MDSDDAIAIVGIGCKFPGAENLEEFWRVLANGEDHVKDIPKDRYDVEAYYDSDPDAPGKSYIRKAGLVSGINEWDKMFFGKGDNEAKRMDPQQRLVLECVYKAMEDGGITKANLDRSETGVYIGVMNGEFEARSIEDIKVLSNYSVTGLSRSVISAQVAYFLNLHGPALTLDTACSSSLVAIHTGAQAIRTGEITLAICGGVNVLLSHMMSIVLSKARMASPTGKCHTFSKNADGYVRGEGCGVVILKRLGDAIRDNDKVWGTIVTACNQDGHENSPITAPAESQQIHLLEKIFNKSGIDPGSVQYIEAHGTGTPVGDPIEANALGKFFGSHFIDRKIKIGSVKTNIGHLESAAGVAGLIKVLLMMKQGYFVPSLHADEQNDNIPFEEYGFTISKDHSKWNQSPEGCRLASINSFGFGGTNSHAIVYSSQRFNRLGKSDKESMSEVLFPRRNAVVLSAVTRDSLQKMVHDVRENLTSMSSLEDLSYTSIFCRDHFKFRKLILTDSKENLQKQLQTVLEQNEQTLSPVPSTKPQIAFVFCGVGTTWTGMCSEMIDVNPVFRKCVLEIDSHLKKLGASITIYDAFQNKNEDYTNPILAHIAIFATQLALAESWKHVGICPSAIVGQSVGEVAAAYESGALSLGDAVTVIYYRSLALSTCQNGAMMVIRNCATETVSLACAKIQKNFRCKLNVAVYNSTESCTVSGDKEALERLKTYLADDTVFIPLRTPCAYHSHHTKDASKDLIGMLHSIKPNAPCIRTFSTVTGAEIKSDFASPEYWALNVSQPVLFMQSMKSIKETLDKTIFVEIGPRPVFQAHFSAVFPETDDIILPSMNKMSEMKTFSNTLNKIFEKGIPPIWKNFTAINGNLCRLPRYVFSKNDCSIKSDINKGLTQGNDQENYSGRMIQSTKGPNWKFSVYISKLNTPFVYEHIVDDRIILPGALYGEIALEIGRNIWNGNVEELEISWRILKPLEIGMTEEKYLPIDVDFPSSLEVEFKVREKEGSRVLAEGTVKHVDQSKSEVVDVASIDGTLGKQKSNNEIYSFLNRLGFKHGSTFRIISGIQSSTNDNLAEIILTKTVQMELPRACFHPVIIDGMFQSCFNPTLKFELGKQSRILPTGVKKFTVKQSPTKKMTCFSRLMLHQNSKVICNALLLRENGTIVAEMQGFEMNIVSGENETEKHFLEEKWQLTDIPKGERSANRPSLIVSWDEQTMIEAKTVFYRISTHLETVNLSSNLQMNNFLSTLPERKGVDLYFVPGFVTVESSEDGNQVLQYVQKSAHLLLTILQKIDLDAVRLYIITEWTQGGEEREVCGVFGSELWGIGRSFQLEHSDFKLTMIDLHGNWLDLQNSIVSTICSLENGTENILSREFIISSKGVSRAKIQHFPSTYFVDDVKTVDPLTEKHFSVRTRSISNKPSFFLVPNLESTNNNTNVCSVSIDKVLLCFKNYGYPSPSTIPVTRYWSHSLDIGHDVMACEFTGQSLKNGKQIVGCSLINVASSVEVNKLCICELQDIPFYRMGMFFNTVVAMSFAEKIEKKKYVYVLHDKEHEDVAAVLKALLQKKHCLVKTEEFHISNDSQDPSASVLIVLTKQVTCPFELIIRLFPNLQQLLSIKGLLPLSTTLNDPTNYPHIESYVVDIFDIFEQTKMQNQFKRATRLILEIKDVASRIPQHVSEGILNVSILRESIKIEIPSNMLIRKDSAYIVIGGLTGLGWEVTKLLAARGAKIVISLSRRFPSEVENRRIENIKRIRSTYLWHKKVDIAKKEDLDCVFARLLRNLGITKIRGIFHGAGVLRDTPVKRLTTEMFDVPLIPKVLGTWNLHRVTENMDLDYFVMHSSIVSLLGNRAQSNYAAGNAFMDAFAHYRRSIGKAAQVINWGLLSVGMGADQNIQAINAMNGFYALSKHEIVNAMNCALITNKVQFAVADLNTSLLGRKFEKHLESSHIQLHDGHADLVNALPEHMENKDQSLQSWVDVVKLCAASILSVDQSEIKDTSILLDFGLDSQKAIELINYLFESSQIRLPVVYLMTGKNTVTDIAGYFLSKLTKEDATCDDDFISESPSSLELHYFDLYESDSNNPHFTITLDFTVSWELNSAEIWKTSLLNLILINPELRTIFQKTEPGQKRADKRKLVLDIEDVCFDFFKVSSNDELQKVFKEVSKFDPHVDIPIKAMFWNSPTCGALRLILNHCCIDNGSVSTIVKDLGYIMKYYIIHRCFPEVTARESLDSALLIEKRMRGEVDELKSFWNTELSKCKKSQSFEVLETSKETFNSTGGVLMQRQSDEHKLGNVTTKHWSGDHNTSKVITKHWSGDYVTNEMITKHSNGEQKTTDVNTKQWNGNHESNSVITKQWNGEQKTSDINMKHWDSDHNTKDVNINHWNGNQKSSDVTTKIWSAGQFQNLEDTSKKGNFSLFSLFCTAFQLTLSKQLQCQRICVINAIDMRLHFPEFRDRIALCVNYVPMVSPDLTNPESTLHTVLTENKIIIVDGISKSIFPFKHTKELPTFRNDIHMTHSIIMEDLTLWKDFNSSHIRLSNFGVEQDSTYETCLSVIIHPTKSLELRLRYSVEKVGRYNAENILENIEELLLNTVSNPDMKLHTWQPSCKQEKAIEGLPHVYFFLCKKNGKPKKKKVLIQHNPVFTLEWGSKQKTRVAASDIKLITGAQLPGNHAEDLHGIHIKTSHSEVRLFTKNRRHRDAWISVLKRKRTKHFESTDL
ncbi:uncharacterized protein LOC130051405 [Ostrea edulis]|uniref:uncharacterized protein LOC130051405 n=1 Tax=Ostrea edulis TaxID=37623 RepID=UPI0024AF3F61|nr:uncharacterized protein LOC130051405 [Ostrea edulis]